MADFPGTSAFSLGSGGVLSTMSVYGTGVTGSAGSGAAWPAANRAIFVPIRIAEPVKVYKLVVGSGATATGNLDVGIYDAQGNRIVSSGAVAKVASAEQIVDIADTQIGPGLFYLALAHDGTASFLTLFSTSTLQKHRLYGAVQMAAAYTLPASATFAALTSGYVPLLAAYLRSA